MMTSILEFMNSNVGAISAIATVALAILTFVYVRLTGRLAKEAKRQADLLLNERKLQLHRELTENIYVPLSKAIIPLKECLVEETPPIFNEWTRIKEQIPFLAYRIKKSLFDKLETLAHIHGSYFFSYESRSKELGGIIRDHFWVLKSISTFWFIYDKDKAKAFNIYYLNLIFAEMELKEHVKLMARIVNHSQQIDEERIEFAENYPDAEISTVLNLNEFKERWEKVKNRIEEHRDLSDWLKLKQEVVSKSTDILADLEELIRSNPE